MEIKIDPEFRRLIPPISEDEAMGLERSLLNEGCRDPLVLWDDTLLDGHNRLEICQKNEIKFKTICKTFDDREQAKLWIISNQLSRRNLTPQQISDLRGKRYLIEKKEDHRPKEKGGQSDHLSEKTATKLAKEYGVSERTIRRDAKFAEAVDKLPTEEKARVLSGKSPRAKSEIVNPNRSVKPKAALPSGTFQSGEDLFVLSSRWEDANKTTRKAFLEIIFKTLCKTFDAREQTKLWFISEQLSKQDSPDTAIPDLPDSPLEIKNFFHRLDQSWKKVPKRIPEKISDDWVRKYPQMEVYANGFFLLFEPFIRVLPSDDFIKRIQAAPKVEGKSIKRQIAKASRKES